jgi:hypothetical protein
MLSRRKVRFILRSLPFPDPVLEHPTARDAILFFPSSRKTGITDTEQTEETEKLRMTQENRFRKGQKKLEIKN